MASKPGTTSADLMPVGQFAELLAAATKCWPRTTKASLAQHLIENAGYFRLVLAEMMDDIRILRVDQTWLGIVQFGEGLFTPEAVFADCSVRSYLGMGPGEMATVLRRKAHWPRPVRKRPFVLWSEAGSLRSIDALRMIKLRNLTPATPIELVACISQLSLPDHIRGLLALQPVDLGSNVPQIGQYDRLTERPFWKFDLPRREQEWHPRYGFLAFGEEE